LPVDPQGLGALQGSRVIFPAIEAAALEDLFSVFPGIFPVYFKISPGFGSRPILDRAF